MTLPQTDDFGPPCLAASWAMFVITAIFVTLRLYCRRFYGPRQWALDDYITIFTIFIFCFSVILLNLSVRHGLGKRYAEVEATESKQALFWLVMLSSVGIWSFSIPKLAIVALIQRLLHIRTLSRTGVLLWGLAALSQAAILIVSVLWYKQCQPVAYQWDLSLVGSCPEHVALMNWGYASSAYSAFLDVFFALFPIPAIMRLNMPLRNRIFVSLALGLSSIGCAVSVYKIIELVHVLPTLSSEPLHPMPYLFVLVFAETMVLVTCASAPALGPVFYILRVKVSSYRGRSNEDGGGDDGGESNQGSTLITFGGSSWKNVPRLKHGRSDGRKRDLSPARSLDEIPLAKVESASVHRTQSDHSIPS